MKKKTDGGYDIPEEDLREMQKGEERQAEEEGIVTGGCRFCGQTAAVDGSEGQSAERIEELATLSCSCHEAREYRKQKEQIEKAKKRIEELFGLGAGEKELDPVIVNSMSSFVDMIAGKKMKAVTVDVGKGYKAKISRMAKGSIKVERTETKKASYEE